MRFIITLIFLFGIYCTAICSPKIDSVLQKKIITMFKQDQKWRLEANKLLNSRPSIFTGDVIEQNMGKADSINIMEAKVIINKYGFPGFSLVGEDGSNGFWAIIQHCDEDVVFQQKALLLMAKQVRKHNASSEEFALLQDRVLTNQGKKQLYGTQVRVDPQTHHASPFPITDSINVDARRNAVGLQPLKDYLKSFDRH